MTFSFRGLWSLLPLVLSAIPLQVEGESPPYTIGYTKERIDVPGGQFHNWITARACIVNGDGTGRKEIAPALAQEQYAWTQFAGWSRDGKLAIVGRGWETPENAAWEREHKTFRMTEGWLFDMFLVDPLTGDATNITSVERVSDYNTGVFYWPNDPTKLGFTPLIEGISHPFKMNLDGTGKEDLSEGTEGFTYGFNASPDGSRIAYHKDYQIHVANADGSGATQIDTGHAFNFCPIWSPDGEWVLFVSGEHYDCHPSAVKRDGTGFKKLADRGGYRGVMELLEEPDFHSESSDVPIWSPDGKWVYFTAQRGEATEICRVDLEGNEEQLTRSGSGVWNYHPKVSPDGNWIAFGSTRSEGGRQLFVIPSSGGAPKAITDVPKGFGAYHAHWRPVKGN